MLIILLIAGVVTSVVLVDSWEWDGEDGSAMFGLIAGLIVLGYIPVTYIFNYIVADRVLQVRDKKSILVYLLNTVYVLPLLNAAVSVCDYEDISHYIDIFFTVLLFVFYALLIRYGYTVYRSAIWLMIYAIVLSNFNWAFERGLIILILYISSYVKLYLTAKEYNM